MKKWFFDADYLQACNCDYGCPCEFSAPPTPGFCHGVGVWKIDKGKYGDLSLDGTGLAFAAKWPGAIHEGNGTVCLFVDERASQEQREALLEIGSGKAGGLPFEILATTFSTLLDPQFVPFNVTINGLESSARLGENIRAGTFLVAGRHLASVVSHVGRDDDRDDVTERAADDPDLRGRDAQSSAARPFLRFDVDLCLGLSRHLVRVQRARGVGPVVAPSSRLAFRIDE